MNREKMKKSFVFYGSWWEAIKNLPRDVQGDVLTAIVEYGLSGETTGQLKPITKAMLAMAKAQIDVNNLRYENGKRGGDYGILGGRPPQNPKETPNKPQTNPYGVSKETPNENENENENDIDTLPPNSKEFVPPSLDDMCKYFDEKGYTREAAERAYDYYTEQNWKDSKGKQVKNWKSKCIAVWFKPENKKSDCPKRPWGDHGIAL